MKKILLTGGETLGSVIPLIAVYEQLRSLDEDLSFYWLGTHQGPEKNLVKHYGIPFTPIESGKLRRYFSLRTILAPFLLAQGFFESLICLLKWRPAVVISAGGFVSVPVFMAAKLLKIKSLVHQQDVRPGMANKIMAHIATMVTVALEVNKKAFPGREAVVVGNPVRADIVRTKKLKNLETEKQLFNLENNLPTLLIIGGGTGAEQINKVVWRTLPKLLEFCQIIHITGKGQSASQLVNESISQRYHKYEFLDEDMPQALAIADVAVSRAGFSSLTELSYLGKPSIIIPIPGSHQELNAGYFESQGAVEVFELGYSLGPTEREDFVFKVRSLVEDKDKQQKLSQNIQQVLPPNGTQLLAGEVLNLLQ